MPKNLQGQRAFQNIDILSLIPPDEGELNQIYGHIGSGKTYSATCDVLKDLKQGKVVYASWHIKWDGYDERKKLSCLLWGVLGFQRYFHFYPAENLRFLPIGGDFYDRISKLTSCKIYIDEGHIAYDSYELARVSMEKRVSILDTRHFDRSITVVSQRATAIHITIRGNINRFYKMVRNDFLFWKRFTRYEYQDVDSSERPDENKDPISVKDYWMRKKIIHIFDSKYRRVGTPESQINLAEIYYLTWKQRVKNLFNRK